ncbi:sensor histidine kinase [Marinicrinis lubricantis]|uniref:Sensor histidine kinase n=1 Tax=Marinicrinis lubricantis TaxID=2086470 RepID=A0ABW1IP16_9BACL
MLILYFLSVFAPILLTNVIFYQVTTNNVENQRMKDISRAVEQIRNEFRNEIEDAINLSSVFYMDLMLNEILEANYDTDAAYVEAYDSYLRRVLNSYSPVYHSVQAITVYVDNPTIFHSGGVGYISERVKETDWYNTVKSNKHSQPIVMRTTSDSDGQRTLSILRKMNYYETYNEREKILKIDLNMHSISNIFKNLNLQGNMYLINERGIIDYTTDPDVDYESKRVYFENVPHSEDTIEFPAEYAFVNYLDGWRIVGTISEEEVFNEVWKSRNFVIILASINIVLPTLIIVWITRSLNVRIIRILRHMKKVKNQHFETIEQTDSRDEIGQLTNEFNRMTLQIKSLIDDVYVADIQKKNLELQNRRAQLNALQSQINPHFLFNALETIRMRSLIKSESETAKIIQNMAKIFRNSLVWNKDLVTVKEELELIHCFLEIQKYRFGQKLDYSVEVAESVYGCAIPKLIFLPFVENASIHGIEPLKEGGKIRVRIERMPEDILFTIQDNGAGMTEDQIRQLNGLMESNDEMGEHVGIYNVILRLKLYYGKRFEFRIESGKGHGTMISLRLPIEKNRGVGV